MKARKAKLQSEVVGRTMAGLPPFVRRPVAARDVMHQVRPGRVAGAPEQRG